MVSNTKIAFCEKNQPFKMISMIFIMQKLHFKNNTGKNRNLRKQRKVF